MNNPTKNLTQNQHGNYELNSELKPCPFCGGNAEVRTVSDKLPHVYKKFHNRYLFAGCRACGIVTQLYAMNNHTGSPYMNNANTKKAKKRAIEAWNRRAPDERAE